MNNRGFLNQRYSLFILLAAMLGVGYLTSSTPLEMTAALTGLLAVWLTAQQSLWTWPISLVNVACFFYMFLDVKLYADMTLQIFFGILSIYGWIVWMTGRGDAAVRPTRRITPGLTWLLLAGLILITAGWGFVLQTYTDASIPYVDAFIATLSLIAQYLLSRKILENWLVWILVDVLSVGMYYYKGLTSTAFLYVIFLGIASMGLTAWRREYDGNRRVLS